MSGTLATTVAEAPLHLQASGPLADLIAIAGPLLPPETPISADGTLSLDLSIAGTLRAPEPSGSLTVRAATASYGDLPPATDVALTATVDRTRVMLQTFDATWQDARLGPGPAAPATAAAHSGSGSSVGVGVALQASSRASLSLADCARHGDHSRHAPALVTPDTVREIEGKMALSITAEADALALERVRASAVVDEVQLTLAGVPFTQVVPTRLQLQDGYASIADMHWDSLGNAIRVSGGTNITADELWSTWSSPAGLDLRILGAFAPTSPREGPAQADFTVSGPLRSPHVVGRIDVTNGELRPDTPRVVASELEGSGSASTTIASRRSAWPAR